MTRKGTVGRPGTSAEQRHDARADGERARVRQQFAAHVAREVRRGGSLRRDDARRGRDDERRDLRDQAVADRQDRIGLDRVADGHAAELAHDDAADQVDGDDDHAGHRVAADELARAVHRAVELRLLRDLLAAVAGLVLVDQARVQIGVNRHLLARHRVQREPRRHFRNAARALDDDDELDDAQDQEHHQPDHHVAADDEVAERVDDLAGVAVQQHQPRGGHVQRQPEQRGEEQQRRERRELQRLRGAQGHHQQQQRNRDVQAQQHVHHEGGNRHDQHEQHADHGEGQHHVAVPRQPPDVHLRRHRSLRRKALSRTAVSARPADSVRAACTRAAAAGPRRGTASPGSLRPPPPSCRAPGPAARREPSWTPCSRASSTIRSAR